MSDHPARPSRLTVAPLRALAGLLSLGLMTACATATRTTSLPPEPPPTRALVGACPRGPAEWTDLGKGTPVAAEQPLEPSERAAKAKGKRCTKDTECPGDELCVDGSCKLPGDDDEDEDRAGGDEPAKPAVVITQKAKEHFARGVSLLEDSTGPRYREAWNEFRAAYEESPSPKILSNVGLCAMNIERDGEAIEAYERYLAEVPGIDPRERAKINKDLQVLWARVTPIELSIKPAGAKLLDERTPDDGDPIVNEYGPIEGKVDLGLRAGKHRLRIELEGYEPAEWSFEAKAGEPRSKSLTLRKKGGGSADGKTGTSPGTSSGAGPTGEPAPTEPSAGVPTSVWVMLGVTGALGAGSIVVGALAMDAKATYESYQDGGDRDDAEVVRANGETLNIVTDVLLGATIAAGVTTLILGLTAGPDEPEEGEQDEEPEDVSWSLGPEAGPQGGGLILRGTF